MMSIITFFADTRRDGAKEALRRAVDAAAKHAAAKHAAAVAADVRSNHDVSSSSGTVTLATGTINFALGDDKARDKE